MNSRYHAANDGVVGMLVNRVLLNSGRAVIYSECEQEGAEHTALGGSSVSACTLVLVAIRV